MSALPAEQPDPCVLRHDADGIATLTLNRPASRNALSLAMMDALGKALATIAEDRTVRCVILAAAGPAFCAGHDLKELTAARREADRGRAFFETTMRRCASLMRAIVALPQPVIAAVEATATAAGCQLVATCDLAVTSAGAQFCTPGVNIGLFCSSPAVALSRNVSRKHAMEMLLVGDMISAEDAQRFGLVNRVVAPGQSHAAALDFARKIAAKSTATVKIGKAAFYAQAELGLADAYDSMARVMVENMLIRDAEEGIGAFVDKRAPHWQDR